MEGHRIQEHSYILVTLHRPSNVDNPLQLEVSWCRSPNSRRKLSRSSFRSTRGHCCPATGRVPRPTCASRRAVLRAARIHRLPLTSVRSWGDPHRLRGNPGGVNRAWCSLLHAAAKHRAARDNLAGHERAAGDDPETILEVRPTGRPPVPCTIPLWDGHAGERISEAVVEALMPQEPRFGGDMTNATQPVQPRCAPRPVPLLSPRKLPTLSRGIHSHLDCSLIFHTNRLFEPSGAPNARVDTLYPIDIHRASHNFSTTRR